MRRRERSPRSSKAVNTDLARVCSTLRAPPNRAATSSLPYPEQVRERISTVRSLGYAWGYEEGVDGINSVAVAINDGEGLPIAALHVHGPAYRFPDPERTHDIGLQLADAAAGITEQLSD
ncbi:MAG: hypothetical protein EBY44_10095 [Actinobacteria bacterium]|nr:hypothetical protein [Actinomycetota bacterium]